MKKSLISLILCIFMVCGVTLSAYAQTADTVINQEAVVDSSLGTVTGDDGSDTPSEGTVYTLSLAQAIEMATEGSSQLKVCDINKQNFEKQLKDAYLQQKSVKNVPIYMNQNFDLIFVKNGYYINMFKKYVELSDYERKKTYATIAYDTTQKYFTYKNAITFLDISKSSLNRAEENLTIINQKYELGICSKLEVTNAEIAKNECEANVTKSKQTLDLCKDSLKICLNIEGECEFNLTDDISVEAFSSNLDEDIDKAMTTRYDVMALRIAYELAEEYFHITESLNEDSVIYFSAYTDYVESSNNYNTGVKNIALGIKSVYYDVINAQNSTKIAKDKLDFLKNQYDVYKLQFEMGMITNFVLSAKSDELTAAEMAYTNALYTEKLAVENYNYQITIGI